MPTAIFSAPIPADTTSSTCCSTSPTRCCCSLFCEPPPAQWRSAFVAALFAWHPLHVESVAWASERKDTLSTFFWLLTLIAYARLRKDSKTEGRPTIKKFLHAGAGLFFALALDAVQTDGRDAAVRAAAGGCLAAEGEFRIQNSEFRTQIICSLKKFPSSFCRCARHGDVLRPRAVPGAVSGRHGQPAGNVRCSPTSAYIEKLFWPADLAIIYPYRLRLAGRRARSVRRCCCWRFLSIWRLKCCSGHRRGWRQRLVLVSRHAGADDWHRASRRAIHGGSLQLSSQHRIFFRGGVGRGGILRERDPAFEKLRAVKQTSSLWTWKAC
jgi:hypothetical protein